MGATRGNIDKDKFRAELIEVIESIANIEPQVILQSDVQSGK